MLYPLSYEGGDGAERGAKLGATARKPYGKGSSGPVGRSKLRFHQTKVSSTVWARWLADGILKWWCIDSESSCRSNRGVVP